MMKKLYEKDPVWFAAACIIVYVGGFSTTDSISAAIGMPKLITCLFGLIMSYVLYSFVKENNLSDYYGLRKIKGTPKQYMYFIPLAVLSTVNLWHGFTFNLSFRDTVFYIISMCFVGFLEELIFRGFLFTGLFETNKNSAFIISSVSFGMGHIVNLFLGAPLADTLLQLVYATAIGFLYTIIFATSGSIIPCIVSHAFVNCTSVFAAEVDIKTEILITVIMCVICIIYGIKIIFQRIGPMQEEFKELEKKHKEEEERIKARQKETDMRKQEINKIDEEIKLRDANIKKIEEAIKLNDATIKDEDEKIKLYNAKLKELNEQIELKDVKINKLKELINLNNGMIKELKTGISEAETKPIDENENQDKDDEFLREHCADIYDIFADRIRERDYQSICEEIIRESYHLPAESVRNLVKYMHTKDPMIYCTSPGGKIYGSALGIRIDSCDPTSDSIMYEDDILDDDFISSPYNITYNVTATIIWADDPYDDYLYEVRVGSETFRHIDGYSVPMEVEFQAEAKYGSPYLATKWNIDRDLVGSCSAHANFEYSVFIDISEKAIFDEFSFKYLEECFETVSEAFASDPKTVLEDNSVKSALKEITGYYGSKLWKYHYWLDERGFLPSDLKRGVLSQDGVYNLLTEIDEYKKENYHE